MGRLTVRMVQGAQRAGRYGDGGTLYLVVAPGGSRSWVQRLTIGGTAARPRPRRIPARDARRGARAGVRQPPAGAPRPRSALRQAARPDADLRAGRRAGARGEPGALAQREDRGQLDRVDGEARLPRLREPACGPDRPRGRPARADADLDVEARARPQGSASASAPRCNGRWLTATSSTTSRGRPSTARCPRCRPWRRTSARCPTGRSRHALALIEASRASLSAKACLRFVALTACRSGEARGATWDEVDSSLASGASRRRG